MTPTRSVQARTASAGAENAAPRRAGGAGEVRVGQTLAFGEIGQAGAGLACPR